MQICENQSHQSSADSWKQNKKLYFLFFTLRKKYTFMKGENAEKEGRKKQKQQ